MAECWSSDPERATHRPPSPLACAQGGRMGVANSWRESVFLLEFSGPEYSFPACSPQQKSSQKQATLIPEGRTIGIDFHSLFFPSSLPLCVSRMVWCPLRFLLWEGATSFLLLQHQQPYFLIGKTKAQKDGQARPWCHDTGRARSCPVPPLQSHGPLDCKLWKGQTTVILLPLHPT